MADSGPNVSILMPVKNAGDFLIPCINSIIQQTYSNWELVAINDHSTDESRDVLMNYAANESRIIVVDNLGNGIIPALKAGLSMARGKLITRMDSDDLMSPDKIELMVTRITSMGKGNLVVGLVQYFSDGQLGTGYAQYAEWLNSLSQSQSNFEDIYKECTIPSPCWMVHREDLEHCGGFEHNVYPEDYDLAFRFRKVGLDIVTIPKVIHFWRDYPHRTSRTHEHYKDNRFSALKVMHFLDQDDLREQQLILWGAGKKGKDIAKALKNRNRSFRWCCNNPRKIGKDIFGIRLEDTNIIQEVEKATVIITISGKDDQFTLSEIKRRHPHLHFYSFC